MFVLFYIITLDACCDTVLKIKLLRMGRGKKLMKAHLIRNNVFVTLSRDVASVCVCMCDTFCGTVKIGIIWERRRVWGTQASP